MSTLTNELGLPTALVEAVRRDNYDNPYCDFSVTELITPPRIAQLRRQHRDRIVEDASDRIFSLIGQGIHSILERAAGDRYLVEKRFFHEIDGVKVSGRIDLYDKETDTLQDWKITSRFATKDGLKPEWEQQGNLLAFLMRCNGFKPTKIQFVALYRDWSKMAVERGQHDYPERQVEVFDIPIWWNSEILKFLVDQIKLHQDAAKELPLCSDEERWYKAPKIALMQKGRKRALKLFRSEGEAIDAISDPAKQFIEYRKGDNVRCKHFCDVLAFCEQGRQLILDEEGK